MLNIGWVSASPSATTGYGGQSLEVCSRLMERHNVVCIGQTSDVIVWGGRQEVDTPSGKKLKILALSDQVSAPELINNYYTPEYKLDLIIGFMDAFGIQYLNDVKIPVIGWIPIDGPFTPMWKHYLKNYHKVFAYSRFGYKELLKWFPPAKVGYIPHGISEAFKPRDRDEAREEFELFTPQADSPGQVQREDRIPKDAFLAVNIGANMGPRKELPLLMRTFKKFVDRGHKDAHLYIHTNAFMVFPRGYDLIQWRLMLKAEKNIHFPMYNPIVSPASNEDLAKIYSAADVYVQNCYSEDSRLVTKDGLKNYDEIERGDLAWTLGSEGELELNPVEEIYVTYYKGDLIKFSNKQVDLLVTPKHRVYYYTPKLPNKLQVRQAESFYGKKTRYSIPTTGKWNCINTETILVEGLVPQGELLSKEGYNIKWEQAMALRKEKGWGARKISREIGVPEPTINGWIQGSLPQQGHNQHPLPENLPTNVILELIGWYIAEGSLRKGTGCHVLNNVVFSIYTQEKKLRICNLIKELGLTPVEDKRGVIACSISLSRIMLECGRGAKNKTIPDWCLEFAPRHLTSLYNGLMGGDGSRKGHHVHYHTASDKLRDKFIELCMKLGYSIKFWKRVTNGEIQGRKIKQSEGWLISIREKHNKGTLKSAKHVTKAPYEGPVWCISTRNKNLFVERNGIITLSGNSDAEGFGLPLVESMASGTPIIAPMNSAQTELVEGHGWGVENVPDDMYAQIPVYVPMLPTYPVPNQLSLLEKLEEAYDSPEKRRRYGAAALSYVGENHSWGVCMSAWFRALEEVEAEIKVLDGLAEAFRPSPRNV